MTTAEVELITVKTREVIDAAIHTMEYSAMIIEQSKRLMRATGAKPKEPAPECLLPLILINADKTISEFTESSSTARLYDGG